MKKEDLETGRKLQLRISTIDGHIEQLKNDSVLNEIEIYICDHGRLTIQKESDYYTNKANINLEYLNQLYRDNVLRTLENCKDELEKEFRLL